MNCQKCKDSDNVEFRHAYGTRDGQWHCVCPHDRDYETSITWDYFVKHGPVRSRDKYLSAKVV